MKKFLVLALFPLALASCGRQGQTAQGSMEAFCKDLSAGNWQQAFGAFGEDSKMKEALAELEKEPEQKEMVTAMMGTTDCRVTAAKDNVVTVEVDSIDAGTVLEKVTAEGMALAMAAATSGKSSEQDIQQLIMTKMKEGFSDPKAPRKKSTVAVTMEEKDGHWIPADTGNEQFGAALTGGMGQ